MKPFLRAGALIAPLVALPLACGGSFSAEDDAGLGGDSGNGSSGSGGSGSGSGSSSSGGSTSSGGSGGSGSSGGSTSSGGSGSGGGSSSSGGSSSGSSSGGTVDGGASPCPTHDPVSKTSCSPQGLECEYGSNPVQACDSVATCATTWQIAAPSDSKCSAALGAGCPGTFAGASAGAACSTNGLVCNYPQGRCTCAQSFGGPVILGDAGVQGHWACQDPGAAACPVPRAPLGSACTPDGLSCDYGTCRVPGGTAEKCAGGIWVPTSVACPLNAAL
jgi:hypothetical protein